VEFKTFSTFEANVIKLRAQGMMGVAYEVNSTTLSSEEGTSGFSPFKELVGVEKYFLVQEH
jgi:hypothetical protein